jgi:hypothetical protein
MIVEIKEFDYKGFHLKLVENKGWILIIGEDEYLFPYATAAEAAINEFIRDVIPKNKGKKLKKA